MLLSSVGLYVGPAIEAMVNKREKHYRIRKGKIYARVTFTDPSGRRRDIMRVAESKSQARELAAQILRDLKDHGAQAIDSDRLKFSQLAKLYENARLTPAQYHEGRKISGLRSLKPVQLNLKRLVEYFGARQIKGITPSDIEKYKSTRLETDSVRGRKRAIASVNRELEVLRSVFSYAKREGLIIRSPFERATGIISKADENRRDRVLSIEEERRLLDACVGRCSHLRPLLIAALDTGMRKGELLKLQWQDVELERRTITVTALNSKTARARTVGITNRLLGELNNLWEVSAGDLSELVFGLKDNFKNGWKTLCRIAGVEDFRFHDTRHTAITRWVSRGIPIAEIMRLSGHSTLTAFAIYVNSTEQTVRRGAEALDAFQEEYSIRPGSDRME
jgi:integrase